MAANDPVDSVMTRDPICMSKDSTVVDAAKAMAMQHIGDVLVLDGANAIGIVTDRDIVLRCVALGMSPDSTTLKQVCTTGLLAVKASDRQAEAIRMMRENNVRRVAVVDGQRPVGIVSIGDLARERDPSSLLGSISSAPPNDAK